MSERYDVIIVGGGAAGLSAALVLGRCRRRIRLYDDGQHRNAAAHEIHCLLGQEGTPPRELYATARAELGRYETVTLYAGHVTQITPRGTIFCHMRRWIDGDGPQRGRDVLLVAVAIAEGAKAGVAINRAL